MPINAAQLHLALNHFPIVLAWTSLAFLLWGTTRGSEFGKRAGLLLLVLAALSSIPAFLTGEPAEDFLGQSAAISKELVHEHEEAAEAGFISILIAGGLAAGTWLLSSRNHPKAKIAFLLCLAADLASAGLLARAAHFGGMISHEELRSR